MLVARDGRLLALRLRFGKQRYLPVLGEPFLGVLAATDFYRRLTRLSILEPCFNPLSLELRYALGGAVPSSLSIYYSLRISNP